MVQPELHLDKWATESGCLLPGASELHTVLLCGPRSQILHSLTRKPVFSKHLLNAQQSNRYWVGDCELEAGALGLGRENCHI